MNTIHLIPNPVIRKMAESAFGYKGNSFLAIATETAHIEAEGTRSDYAMVGGHGLETLTRMTPHLDGEVAITPDVILLRHSNFCGHTGITCYVHPSSMPALLREMRLRQSNHVLQ